MERKRCRAEAAEAPGLLRSARTQCSGQMAAGAQARLCPWALPPTACLPASIPRPSKMAARTEGPRVGGFLRGIWREVAEKLGKWLRGKFPAPSAASAVTLCPVPHPALPSCSPQPSPFQSSEWLPFGTARRACVCKGTCTCVSPFYESSVQAPFK